MAKREKTKKRIPKKFIVILFLVGSMAAASAYPTISSLFTNPDVQQLSIGIKNNHCLSKVDANGTITGFAIYPEMQKAIKDAIPTNMTVQNFLMYKEAQDFLKQTCAKFDVSAGTPTPVKFDERNIIKTGYNNTERIYLQFNNFDDNFHKIQSIPKLALYYNATEELVFEKMWSRPWFDVQSSCNNIKAINENFIGIYDCKIYNDEYFFIPYPNITIMPIQKFISNNCEDQGSKYLCNYNSYSLILDKSRTFAK